MKMMLPENVKRFDNKQYEEVNIPILPPSPLNVGNTLIPISSLDEVSMNILLHKIVF